MNAIPPASAARGAILGKPLRRHSICDPIRNAFAAEPAEPVVSAKSRQVLRRDEPLRASLLIMPPSLAGRWTSIREPCRGPIPKCG